MRDIIEFEGKRYPRYWGDDMIGLNEAMARMGAKCYHPGKSLIETGYGALTLHTNSSDVPDGVEHYNINVRHYRRAEECTPALYFVKKKRC